MPKYRVIGKGLYRPQVRQVPRGTDARGMVRMETVDAGLTFVAAGTVVDDVQPYELDAFRDRFLEVDDSAQSQIMGYGPRPSAAFIADTAPPPSPARTGNPLQAQAERLTTDEPERYPPLPPEVLYQQGTVPADVAPPPSPARTANPLQAQAEEATTDEPERYPQSESPPEEPQPEEPPQDGTPPDEPPAE